MIKHAFPGLGSCIIPLFVAAGWIGLAAPLGLGQMRAETAPASSQTASDPYLPTMTFDVASVRENKNIDMKAGYTMGGRFVPNTTNLRLMNWGIESLISYAYGVDEFQIAGAPKWPFPAVFVIEAKSDGEADAKMASLNKEQQKAEQQHMLQALLEERFNLKAHWETKESDTYRLVVAKGGPKLGGEGSTPPSADELKTFGEHPVPSIYQKNDGKGYDFIGHGCTMSRLVSMLTGQFGRPVTDNTGLTGKYDFVLAYRGRWDRDRNPEDDDPMPPMERALQEELGLKVETTRGPVKILVVDHVEKPSEN